MITPHRDEVIENIKECAQWGKLNDKVEVDDPVLSEEEKKELVLNWNRNRKTADYRKKNQFAKGLLNLVAYFVNLSTRFKGLDNIREVSGGAIITSNHFNPLDNTAILRMAQKAGKKRLFIVSEETNFAMKGIIGFFMKYTNTIPITTDREYMEKDFYPYMQEQLQKGEYVLLYPEQEMWFNYRKPRPPKRGAYYFAAKMQVPIISCFVEIRDMPPKEAPKFHWVRYVVHVLKPIYPDPKKSIRENSVAMMNRDYEQKKDAYERAYHKPLVYDFYDEDIAGWIPEPQNKRRKNSVQKGCQITQKSRKSAAQKSGRKQNS